MGAGDARTPVFVRLPAEQAAALDEASRRLRLTKGGIVGQALGDFFASAGLDAPQEHPLGIAALRGAPLGRHTFSPAPDREPEVLTVEGLAELLELDVETARALAEAGEIPGRKLGDAWRFSRAAVLAWLAGN